MKGLIVGILEDKYIGNCSNAGISKTHKALVLVGDDIPQVFEATDDMPAVKLVRRNIGGVEYIHVQPVNNSDRAYMAGGSFIYSTDSRFRSIISYPISLHDRVE